MNKIFGLDIVISPLFHDVAKLQFGLFLDSPKVQEFNIWLKEQFGTNPVMMRAGNTIYCNQRGYKAMMEMMQRGQEK
jgi:hypothetical protein